MIRRFPSRLREDDLAERVVDLVRAGVVQVLALEVERALPGAKRSARVIGDGRPTYVRPSSSSSARNAGSRFAASHAAVELVERRDQRLRDVPAAVRAEGLARSPSSARRLHVGPDAVVVLDAGRALERRGRVDRPRPDGRRSRRATFSGPSPPASTTRPSAVGRALPVPGVVLAPREVEQARDRLAAPRSTVASRPRTLPSSTSCTWSRSASLAPASPTQTATASVVSGTGSTPRRGARALRREHEAEQVGACLGRRRDVLLARQAAYLDERARRRARRASRPGRARA